MRGIDTPHASGRCIYQRDRPESGRCDPDRSNPDAVAFSSERASVRVNKTRQNKRSGLHRRGRHPDVATSRERASLRSGCLPRFQWSGHPLFAALAELPQRRPCIRYIGGCHRRGRSGLQHKPCKLTRVRTPLANFSTFAGSKKTDDAFVGKL